jgi:hypothetical protein
MDNCNRMKLSALLLATKGYVMSTEELNEQRRSWVIGTIMILHPELGPEEAERIYDQVAEGGWDEQC